MSTPDFDENQRDEDQFDFLADEAANTPARRKKVWSSKELVMPIIRTPVPISESGPARVGSVPADTAVEDDFEFLGNDQPPREQYAPSFDSDGNEAVHDDYPDEKSPLIRKLLILTLCVVVFGCIGAGYFVYYNPNQNITQKAGTGTQTTGVTDTQETDVINSTLSANEAMSDGTTIKPMSQRFFEQLRDIEAMVAGGELDNAEQAIASMDRAIYGYGAPEFTEIERQIVSLRNGTPVDTETVAEAEQAIDAARLEQEAELAAQAARDAEAQRVAQAAELAEQERAAQAALAAEAQRVAEAEKLAEEERAAQAAMEAEAIRLAEAERALAEEAARLAEAQRIAAAEQARAAEALQKAEAARIAEAERAAEALRERAAETARLEEAERIAQAAREAEAVKLAEAERAAEALAKAQAEREADAARLRRAAEERDAIAKAEAQKRAEQRRVQVAASAAAEAERVAQAAAAALAAGQKKAAEESLALATAKAKQRLELDRLAKLANERRLAERTRLSEERAKAAAFAREQEKAAAERAQAQAQLQITPKQENYSITDNDFNFVGGKFVELKAAIENRDIASVIALTQRSGKRVQQMLQIFENNSEVKARIVNVASRNVEGVIVGQLKIQKLVKKSGVEVDAPSNLSSITLTSKRGPEGWSTIAW